MSMSSAIRDLEERIKMHQDALNHCLEHPEQVAQHTTAIAELLTAQEDLIKVLAKHFSHEVMSESYRHSHREQQVTQCPHCNKLYNCEADTWAEFGERVDVALHVLCPPCLRKYVVGISKNPPLPEKLMSASEMDDLIRTRNPGWKRG